MQVSQSGISNSVASQEGPGTTSLAPTQKASAWQAEQAQISGSSGDRTTISSAAALLAQLTSHDTYRADDASRAMNVQQISEALQNGTYTVDSDRLSATLVQSMLQTHAD